MKNDTPRPHLDSLHQHLDHEAADRTERRAIVELLVCPNRDPKRRWPRDDDVD